MVSILTIVGLASLENSFQEGKATLIIKTIGSTKKEFFDANGKTIKDIVQYTHTIRLSSSRLDCIDSVCTNGNYWWQIYINNDLALSSINYIPKKGDIIRIEYGDDK